MAVRRLRLINKVRTLLIDLQFGASLRGEQPTRFPHRGSADVQNSDYAALRRIDWNVRESDVLVDVGCGKGRVINWWLKCGYANRIIGIDHEEEVAERTRQRLRRFTNVTIVTGDALEILPADGTLFFLFHSFDAKVVDRFRARLIELTEGRDNVRIVYLNPQYIKVFENDPCWSIERIERSPEGLEHNDWAIIRKVGHMA